MSRMDEIVARFSRGEMVVVFDDEDRENEADIFVSIDKLTPEKVNFLVHSAKGLVCAALHENIAKARGLPLMSSNKSDKHSTAFTLSVDSLRTRTGISPAERCQTALDLINPAYTLSDFVTPGHMFPLIARRGGLLERRGHTEAAVNLCQWASVTPAALICEMIHPNGGMYSKDQAEAFAIENNISFCTVGDMLEYERLKSNNVALISTANLPTEWGKFSVSVYKELYTDKEHLFLSMGDFRNGPIRIHSECLTGDLFLSRTCDCGFQLRHSLELIAKEGAGGVIYLRQEGRDIGLGEKIKAYSLQQQQGMDTIEANISLGHKADARDFHQAAWILKENGFTKVHLLTNNPDKITCIEKHGMQVVPVAIAASPTTENRDYLLTKKNKMGHKLSFN